MGVGMGVGLATRPPAQTMRACCQLLRRAAKEEVERRADRCSCCMGLARPSKAMGRSPGASATALTSTRAQGSEHRATRHPPTQPPGHSCLVTCGLASV